MYYNEIDETLDLRIRRTHKLLFNALLSLLTEKSFDDVHISDICDEAMVHRTTFYKHFEDKYDLLNYSLKKLIRNFEENSLDNTPINNPRQYYVNLFKILLEHMYENKNMYSVGLLKNGTAIKLLQKIIVERTKSRLESNEAAGIVFSIPVPILSEFYCAAMISLSSWWLENNIPISIEEMVNYGDIMINRLDI